jgi:hypothetical protein
MTQSAIGHTASNDGITMYGLKRMWKQMIVHSFRIVYQHLFTRTEKIYDKIRSEQIIPGRDSHRIPGQEKLKAQQHETAS